MKEFPLYTPDQKGYLSVPPKLSPAEFELVELQILTALKVIKGTSICDRESVCRPLERRYWRLLAAAKELLKLIDEVPVDLGDETDRVFPRYEFDRLREAVEAFQDLLPHCEVQNAE